MYISGVPGVANNKLHTQIFENIFKITKSIILVPGEVMKIICQKSRETFPLNLVWKTRKENQPDCYRCHFVVVLLHKYSRIGFLPRCHLLGTPQSSRC
jgi:hypothetical protein